MIPRIDFFISWEIKKLRFLTWKYLEKSWKISRYFNKSQNDKCDLLNLKGELSHLKQRSQNISLADEFINNPNIFMALSMFNISLAQLASCSCGLKGQVLFLQHIIMWTILVHCAMCFYAMTQSTFCWDLMVFVSKWVHISFLLCVVHITKYRIALLHYQN